MSWEQKLYDVLSKKRNYQLLEDEKQTKRFLSMESRKAGYSEITRLRVKNPLHNPNMPTNSTNRDYFNGTESSQVNTELHSTFKDIYKLQTNLNHTKNALADYLNSDGDTEPMKELQRRKLPRELKRSMACSQ